MSLHCNESFTQRLSLPPAPATIVASPVNTTANISSSITFTCEVMASHSLTVIWRLNGDVRSTDQATVNMGSTHYVSTLEFPSLLLSNTGRYSCEANNQASQEGPTGSDVSDDFCLFVQSEFSLESHYHIHNT